MVGVRSSMYLHRDQSSIYHDFLGKVVSSDGGFVASTVFFVDLAIKEEILAGQFSQGAV